MIHEIQMKIIVWISEFYLISCMSLHVGSCQFFIPELREIPFVDT